MSEPSRLIDYERLAEAELAAAARSPSAAERNAHLDRAAVYAAKNEATGRDGSNAEP